MDRVGWEFGEIVDSIPVIHPGAGGKLSMKGLTTSSKDYDNKMVKERIAQSRQNLNKKHKQKLANTPIYVTLDVATGMPIAN